MTNGPKPMAVRSLSADGLAICALTLLALSLGTHCAVGALSGCLPGNSPFVCACVAVDAVWGVLAICFVPGVLFALATFARRAQVVDRTSQPVLFELLVRSGLFSLLSHSLAHKVAVWSVGRLTYGWAIASSAVMVIAGWLLARRLGRSIPFLWPSRHELRGTAVCSVLFVALLTLTARPLWLDEGSYLPDWIYSDLVRLEFQANCPRNLGIQTTWAPEWVELGSRRRVLRDDTAQGSSVGMHGALCGRIWLVNREDANIETRVTILLHNQSRALVRSRLVLNGRVRAPGILFPYGSRLSDHGADADPSAFLIAGRYDRRLNPRNWPPGVVIVSPLLDLRPGTNTVDIWTQSLDPGRRGGVPVIAVDMSVPQPDDLIRVLRRHFFIGDTGDFRETLDFARNFVDHPVQYSTSFDGERMDDGGYSSISDEPPMHHFVCMLALVWLGDSVRSITFLYLGELVLVLWLALGLVGMQWRGRKEWLAGLVPVSALLVYARFVRPGLESATPEALFLLLFLTMAKCILDGHWRTFLVVVAVAQATHAPAPGAVLFLCAAHLFVFRELRVLKLLAQAVGTLAAATLFRLVVVGAIVGWSAALYSGQGSFGSSGRLETLGGLLSQGEWGNARVLLLSTLEFGGFAFAAGCYALVALWPRDRTARLLAISALLYLLALCVLDHQRAHTIGPFLIPMAIAAARTMLLAPSGRRRAAMAIAVPAMALCSYVFSLLSGPDYTGRSDWIPILSMVHPSNRRAHPSLSEKARVALTRELVTNGIGSAGRRPQLPRKRGAK